MSPLQWFEKTVEYKYVIDSIYNGVIYPFSGDLETWFGDAMHSRDGKFILIEFKRSASECRTEFDKIRDRKLRIGHQEIIAYINKELGTREIYNQGHYLVYGKINHETSREEQERNKSMFYPFNLMQRNYWDASSEKFCARENMTPFDNVHLLKKYLMVLYSLRRVKKSSSGDGSFVEVRHEDQTLLMTINEFIMSYDYCLKHEISSNSTAKIK